MYFPFQNCQNLFYRTIIIEMANINVKQGSKTLLFPFLTPCASSIQFYLKESREKDKKKLTQ